MFEGAKKPETLATCLLPLLYQHPVCLTIWNDIYYHKWWTTSFEPIRRLNLFCLLATRTCTVWRNMLQMSFQVFYRYINFHFIHFHFIHYHFLCLCCRFCSQQYTLDSFDESIHLSNNAIQKHYKNGPRSKELPDENMWTHEDFINFAKYGLELWKVINLLLWNHFYS